MPPNPTIQEHDRARQSFFSKALAPEDRSILLCSISIKALLEEADILLLASELKNTPVFKGNLVVFFSDISTTESLFKTMKVCDKQLKKFLIDHVHIPSKDSNDKDNREVVFIKATTEVKNPNIFTAKTHDGLLMSSEVYEKLKDIEIFRNINFPPLKSLPLYQKAEPLDGYPHPSHSNPEAKKLIKTISKRQAPAQSKKIPFGGPENSASASTVTQNPSSDDNPRQPKIVRHTYGNDVTTSPSNDAETLKIAAKKLRIQAQRLREQAQELEKCANDIEKTIAKTKSPTNAPPNYWQEKTLATQTRETEKGPLI